MEIIACPCLSTCRVVLLFHSARHFVVVVDVSTFQKPFLLCPPNGVESLLESTGENATDTYCRGSSRFIASGKCPCPGVNCMYVTNNNFSSFLLSPSFCSGAVGYDQRGFVGLDSLSIWTSISHAWGKLTFTCSCRYYYSVPIRIDPRC